MHEQRQLMTVEEMSYYRRFGIDSMCATLLRLRTAIVLRRFATKRSFMGDPCSWRAGIRNVTPLTLAITNGHSTLTYAGDL